MKRSGFKRPTYTPAPVAPLAPIPIEMRHRIKMARADEMAEVVPKDAPWRSEGWRRAVASLACVRCGRQGQTQAAHRNEGKGMGSKVDDSLTAALCGPCHSEIDQGGKLTRDERRAELDRAILETVRQMARQGLVRVA